MIYQYKAVHIWTAFFVAQGINFVHLKTVNKLKKIIKNIQNQNFHFKLFLVLSLFLFSVHLYSQPYFGTNINLLSVIDPNSGKIGVGDIGRHYMGCWGWYQAEKAREYAIVGASNGTYFIDITNPVSPSVSAFVAGKEKNNWREIKTYQNYCYVVSDDSPPNTFQIIDMSALPATVTVVHDGVTYFERGHTIFIEGNKMYVGGTSYANWGGFSSMNVYSLATPTAPVLLRRLDQDFPFISGVHDMYVRNDTIFASCGSQGLYVLKFIPGSNTFSVLGSYTNYAVNQANHSSYLTENGRHLIFTDEKPSAPIRLINVQNLDNIQPGKSFIPYSTTTPHNPYIIGNSWAVVACYQDGLNIYNISDPEKPELCGSFDTYPQGGANVSNYFDDTFLGTWGAYPFLPSGVIIASDVQNGLFILDASAAFNINGIKSNTLREPALVLYPNPAADVLSINYFTQNNSTIRIKNMMGQIIFEKSFIGVVRESIQLGDFDNGTYFVSLTENNRNITKKLIVNR